MAIEITGDIRRSITGTLIALFAWILDFVATFLGRCAVVAARVKGELAGVTHLAVDEVAVVADLTWFEDAVATADEIDADRLVSGALLSLLAVNTEYLASIG